MKEETDFPFCVTFLHNENFKKLQKFLRNCKLHLYVHESEYNKEFILRSNHNEQELDWQMDAGLFASGRLFTNVEKAKDYLNSLSECLQKAGITHEILMDYNFGESTYTIGMNEE